MRKFPPLVELLEKEARETALENVTGGSHSTAADEVLKPVRLLNSEQRWYREGSRADLLTHVRLLPSRTGPQGAFQTLPLIFQQPEPRKRSQRLQQSGCLHLPFVPRKSPRPYPSVLAAKVSQLPPLPATLESKLCELPEIQSLRTCHGGTAMTGEQMENFSGTKCAHKKWILALKCIFTVQLSSLLKSPSSNLTYLGGVLIYVSDEGAVYLANEDSPSPMPTSSRL